MEDVPKRFDDLLEMAKLITNTEFLLKMRSMEMHNRQIMQKFLKFLVAHVKFNVISPNTIYVYQWHMAPTANFSLWLSL